jgi:hypothetical protein
MTLGEPVELWQDSQNVGLDGDLHGGLKDCRTVYFPCIRIANDLSIAQVGGGDKYRSRCFAVVSPAAAMNDGSDF